MIGTHRFLTLRSRKCDKPYLNPSYIFLFQLYLFRELHSTVSKVGKAIDRNFVSDFDSTSREDVFRYGTVLNKFSVLVVPYHTVPVLNTFAILVVPHDDSHGSVNTILSKN
jgi:hypothetical protein